MGTNFYLKRIVTEDDIQHLHKLVDERKFTSDWEHEDDIRDSVANMVADITSDGIHIGKRSWGWQFSFDHNWGKYWQPNRKSLEEYLSRPGYEIFNEYGEKLTYDEFWNAVDSHNANPQCHYTSKSYREEERKEHPGCYQSDCADDWAKCTELFGIKREYDSTDFEVDGLRFPVFSDFC